MQAESPPQAKRRGFFCRFAAKHGFYAFRFVRAYAISNKRDKLVATETYRTYRLFNLIDQERILL